MSQTNESVNLFDPTGLFKTLRDSNVEAWSKMMIQLVNTEAYARATAVMLDAWLSTSAPFREAMESAVTKVLTSLNMPTREDLTRLAGRLTNIEMRLDDLEARLEEGLRPARKNHGGPKARPSPGEK